MGRLTTSLRENWEYYPLTQREIDFVVDNVMTIVDPNLIKIIVKDGDVVGFVFPFPDVSAAMQKNKGKLGPIAILRLLLEIKHTNWISLTVWVSCLNTRDWVGMPFCMPSWKSRCINIRSLLIPS